jgi:hypothetical protein
MVTEGCPQPPQEPNSIHSPGDPSPVRQRTVSVSASRWTNSHLFLFLGNDDDDYHHQRVSTLIAMTTVSADAAYGGHV